MSKLSEKLLDTFKQRKLNKILNFSEIIDAKESLARINADLNNLSAQAGFDPSHKTYTVTQNLLSYFSEEVSVLDDFEAYYDMVLETEEEFIPSGPPMSPLTASYFTFWCFLDLEFGKHNETIGSIFYELGIENDVEEVLLKAIHNLNQSYMGLYKHMGFDNDIIILKDIISGEKFSCICPAGYQGKKNEIWFVRIAPNLDQIYDYHIILILLYEVKFYNVYQYLFV